MWKLVNGKLMHTKDDSRVKFRTNISENILETIQVMAKQNNTHVNYLIENGLINLIQHGVITFNKKYRPKDRIQFKTTYDKELLEELKSFAKKHDLFINDVIEYSVSFIDTSDIKNADYRYRIEKKV